MSIAHTVATRSPCVKRQVGAVLVSEDKALLATGFNGPPRGAPHRDEKTCVRIGIPSGTQADVVCCAHAESNAIAQAARHGVPVKGSTLYVTTSPCAWCARGIINAGVVRVVREGAYNDPIAAGVFAESDVPVEELPAVPVSPELQKLAACMSLPAGSGMAEISVEIQRLQTRTRAIDDTVVELQPEACGRHCCKPSCEDPCILPRGHDGWCICRTSVAPAETAGG
jgi:dCMP deaminase